MTKMAVAELQTDKAGVEQAGRRAEVGQKGEVAVDVGNIRGWRVTDRDRLLVGHLATVRYLAREQVWRLVFPGRAESVVAERLVALERLGLLRRLRCRRYTGEELEVFALTLAGYRLAEDVSGPLQRIPAHDVGDAFVEHHIGLVELYLGVLGAGVERIGPRRRREAQVQSPGARRPNSDAPPSALPSKWKWISGDQLQRLHLSRKVKPDEPVQVLVPDAVAEFPLSGSGPRRMFIEWETGSNPLAAEEKRNSLVTKLERYSRFLTDYAELLSGPTWYTKAFPDKWPARVRFVMHSERRKKNALEVLSKWRERQTPSWKELDFEVLTAQEVIAEMRIRIPGSSSPQGPLPQRPDVTLCRADFDSLRAYYDSALRLLRPELERRKGDAHVNEFLVAAKRAREVLSRGAGKAG